MTTGIPELARSVREAQRSFAAAEGCGVTTT